MLMESVTHFVTCYESILLENTSTIWIQLKSLTQALPLTFYNLIFKIWDVREGAISVFPFYGTDSMQSLLERCQCNPRGPPEITGWMKETPSVLKQQLSSGITSTTMFPFETLESVIPCLGQQNAKTALWSSWPVVHMCPLQSLGHDNDLGTAVKGFCTCKTSLLSVDLIMIGR